MIVFIHLLTIETTETNYKKKNEEKSFISISTAYNTLFLILCLYNFFIFYIIFIYFLLRDYHFDANLHSPCNLETHRQTLH